MFKQDKEFKVQVFNRYPTVKYLAWSEKFNVLRVVFVSGTAYDYHSISEEIFNKLRFVETVDDFYQCVTQASKCEFVKRGEAEQFVKSCEKAFKALVETESFVSILIEPKGPVL